MRRQRGQGHTTSACQQCHTEFRHPARFAQKYCSPACRYVAQSGATNWLGTFTCANCGQEFQAARTLERVTCSRKCALAIRAQRRDPTKQATTACPTCGKNFEFYLHWPRKFCSNACAGKANVSNIKSFQATGFDAICQQCGRTFHATPKSTRGRFCSRTCFGDWLSANNVGEANPKWRGGHAYGPTWIAARNAVRERDGVCQDCGATPTEGRALDVHHIKPFHTYGREHHAEANVLSNLVALCSSCHIEREWSTNWIMTGKKPFGHQHVPPVTTHKF